MIEAITDLIIWAICFTVGFWWSGRVLAWRLQVQVVLEETKIAKYKEDLYQLGKEVGIAPIHISIQDKIGNLQSLISLSNAVILGYTIIYQQFFNKKISEDVRKHRKKLHRVATKQLGKMIDDTASETFTIPG